MISLRPYQQDAVDALRASYRAGHRAPLLVSPTASGKTYMFCYITQGAAAKGNRVCILVHRQELLTQTSASLDAIGVDHGRICAGRGIRAGEQVQVASVQTLVRRLGKVPPPDLIIVDEAHHSVAGAWGKVLAAFPQAAVLGVTATPERLDGRGLGKHCGGVFDDLVHGPSVADLIPQGFLSRPVYYAPPADTLDLTGVHMQGGDFKRKESAAAVGASKIVGDAVAHYRRICPGAPAIAFCVSVAEANRTAEQFRAAGFNSATLDGSLTDGERAARIRALGNGGLHVLTSCEIVSEGFDLPVVTAAILLRPTASLSLHLQQVGRVLRTQAAPGYDMSTREGRLAAIAAGPKPCSYIIDHVGNLLRLGLAEDAREWSLDGRKKRKREGEAGALPNKQCPRCFAVHAPAPKCPQCGHQYDPEARQLEQVEGELQEIDAAALAVQRAKRREVATAKTIDDLLQVAAARGYKPSWAEHVFNARAAKAGQAGAGRMLPAPLGAA